VVPTLSSSTTGPERVSAARRGLVDKARDSWIAQLIDLSRRNNLLFYRDLQAGTLDLSTAPEDQIHALLKTIGEADSGVSLRKLVPDPAEETRAAARLREICGRALSNLEERGLDTLFLGLGLVEWTAQDGGRPIEAPILLMPLSSVQRPRPAKSWAPQAAALV
jgi:hypothetical protein